MSSRRYTQLTLIAMALLMGVVLLLSRFWVGQPQTGDLARIGGYVEHRYESQAPETRSAFETPLYQPLKDQAEDDPMDVLVLGDSFSYTGGRYNWVSQFAARTGLVVRVASIHRWREVWQQLNQRDGPPPLVIVQSVERDAVDHLANINHRFDGVDESAMGAPTPTPALVFPGPMDNIARSPLPAKSFRDFEERISVTVDVAWKSLRRLLGIPRSEVVAYDRNTDVPPPFSAADQDTFVTIPADVSSANPPPWRMKQAISGLTRMQATLEQGGGRLELLLIPNRLSVYRGQLRANPQGDREPLAVRMARDTASFDATEYLQARVDQGVRDVYWAMDTHLSAIGAALLADGFTTWLVQTGVLSPANHD